MVGHVIKMIFFLIKPHIKSDNIIVVTWDLEFNCTKTIRLAVKNLPIK